MLRGSSVVAALVQAAILVGCSGVPAISPTPEPAQTPAPTATLAPTPAAATSTPTPATTAAEERIFSSDDGALTIIVPAGALPAEVDLVATARGPDDRPPELADLPMSGTFYRLEPDGLTFAQPVTLIRRVALADLGIAAGDPVPIVTLALRTSDGSWNWLDNPTFMNDGEYLYISGEATHTSQVFSFAGGNYSVQDGPGPGSKFYYDISTLSTEVTVPIDSPEPPTITTVKRDYLGNTEPYFSYFTRDSLWEPGQDRDDPRLFTGELDITAQINNPTGWSELSANQRANSFPSANFGLSCIKFGHFYTLVGYEVVRLAAVGGFFDSLDLGAPATTVVFPLHGECVEGAPTVEVVAACLTTNHTARGGYPTYLRGLIKLFEVEYGLTVTGVDVTLGDANDGQPAAGEPQGDDVWQFNTGIRGPGKKKIEEVMVQLDGGATIDVTEQVRFLLGGDTIDVPYPGTPVFGICPNGAD